MSYLYAEPSRALGAPPTKAAPAATPAFRFRCDPGCAPHAANQCRAIVSRAIRDAIALAESAADKLEANPRNIETLRLFKFFFGHVPARPVSWAGNQESGAIVAKRFRAAAHGFRTRVPHIVCDPRDDCNAFVFTDEANTINVCPGFWNTPNSFHRAAILLHEMLHLIFPNFFAHQENRAPGDGAERRRNNSRCYEAFSLRVAGHGALRGDVAACIAQPA